MDGSKNDAPPLVPELISEATASCVRFVMASVGVQLDLTHETLPVLDHYVRTSRQQLIARPEAVPLVATAIGAYFGQVLAVEFGGLWRTPSVDVHEWCLYFQPVFLALNPVGVGYEMLFQAEPHDGPSAELQLAKEERDVVEARLRALPEVTEDDYYTFATRFDTIQTSVEVLRALQKDQGFEDVTYEWADYEDALGPR